MIIALLQTNILYGSRKQNRRKDRLRSFLVSGFTVSDKVRGASPAEAPKNSTTGGDGEFQGEQ
jgi:hypothetical protein